MLNRTQLAVWTTPSVEFLLAILFGLFPAARTAGSATELLLEKVLFGTEPKELSGMAMREGVLYAVTDDASDRAVYRVRENGTRFDFVSEIDLTRLHGFEKYLDSLEHSFSFGASTQHFDLEGISICGDAIYLANERTRQILRIVHRRSLESLPISFDGFPDLRKGGENAGFEGVAVDCDNRMLYIAKERSPRALLAIRMRDWRVLRVSESSAEPSDLGNPVPAPDWSDLTLSNGYLYGIERRNRDILKIDPSTFNAIDRVSYGASEEGLYDTNEPYGMAEALVLTRTHIILGFDNNRTPLSKETEKKFGVKGNPPVILYFKRPPGF